MHAYWTIKKFDLTNVHETHFPWLYYVDIKIRDTFVYKHTPPVSSFLLPSSSPTQLIPKTTSSFLCLILSTLPFLGGNSTPQNVFLPLPPTSPNGEPSDKGIQGCVEYPSTPLSVCLFARIALRARSAALICSLTRSPAPSLTPEHMGKRFLSMIWNERLDIIQFQPIVHPFPPLLISLPACCRVLAHCLGDEGAAGEYAQPLCWHPRRRSYCADGGRWYEAGIP